MSTSSPSTTTPGATRVNQENRLKLMLANARQNRGKTGCTSWVKKLAA